MFPVVYNISLYLILYIHRNLYILMPYHYIALLSPFYSVVTTSFWAPKSLQMVAAAMKLKDTYSLEGKL